MAGGDAEALPDQIDGTVELTRHLVRRQPVHEGVPMGVRSDADQPGVDRRSQPGPRGRPAIVGKRPLGLDVTGGQIERGRDSVAYE